jgi:hypothetical protein
MALNTLADAAALFAAVMALHEAPAVALVGFLSLYTQRPPPSDAKESGRKLPEKP